MFTSICWCLWEIMGVSWSSIWVSWTSIWGNLWFHDLQFDFQEIFSGWGGKENQQLVMEVLRLEVGWESLSPRPPPMKICKNCVRNDEWKPLRSYSFGTSLYIYIHCGSLLGVLHVDVLVSMFMLMTVWSMEACHFQSWRWLQQTDC